jgi:hypothetical protein
MTKSKKLKIHNKMWLSIEKGISSRTPKRAYILWLSLVLIVLIVVIAFYPQPLSHKASDASNFEASDALGLVATSTKMDTEPADEPIVPEIVKKPVVVPEKNELIDNEVPFISQAPFGDWADQRQQDGCEEASALMAAAWARGEALDLAQAEKEIELMSDYLLKEYGEYRDVHVTDVIAWIFSDYLDFSGASLIEDASLEDIILELMAGHLVLAPADGRALKNPYFTPPGPERHMLVLRGYDPIKKEFITNDPGTRRGRAYRYDQDLLFAAIMAYPTGYHEAVEGRPKDVIVVAQE